MSVDVSNDTQVLVPVCEPILTSGMTVIKLKLQDPQIAQVKTFFGGGGGRVRVSAVIGLSQKMRFGSCNQFLSKSE